MNTDKRKYSKQALRDRTQSALAEWDGDPEMDLSSPLQNLDDPANRVLEPVDIDHAADIPFTDESPYSGEETIVQSKFGFFDQQPVITPNTVDMHLPPNGGKSMEEGTLERGLRLGSDASDLDRTVRADSEPASTTLSPMGDGVRWDRPAELKSTVLGGDMSPPPITPVTSPGPSVQPNNAPDSGLEPMPDDDQAFERKAGAPKLGIIGGKGVGKSYLFQAMVARSFHTDKAGSLAYYLAPQGIRLHTAVSRKDPARLINPHRFVDHYNAWKRIANTMADTQRWYRLSLPYRTGIFGWGCSYLDVEFFEASGEGLLELEYMGQEELELWKDAYLDATVMVFCLPLWAAFPKSDLADEDWQKREQILTGFYQVVHNYNKLRENNKLREKYWRDNPVRGILALTMADDPRCVLDGLRDRWITPYLDAPDQYLDEFAKGRGVARYMANARKISEYLRLEFKKIRDSRVSGIPNLLNFNSRQAWLIPLSAIEGKTLDNIERQHSQHRYPGRFDPPVPVHVELPLLVALCERENALM